MARRLKLLTSLSTVALTGALALSACGAEGESAEGEGESAKVAAVGAEGESAESKSSESEGGESEGGSYPDTISSDVAYLQQLILVRGHLLAFRELYKDGLKDHASMHVKHPESELYAALIPAFEARKKPGFAEALQSLGAAFEGDAEVEAVYEATIHAIEANAPDASIKDQLLAIAAVVTVAADEYKIAVDAAGAIVNLHEYQDAYGFVGVAREMARSMEAASQDEIVALEAINAQIEELMAGFDGWAPAQVEMQASMLYGAAARIEIAALGL